MAMFFPLGANTSAVSASTVFYLTLLFIFATAIITTVVTKWSRDKCLKFFNHYHITVQRTRGLTIWGRLKVFSSGLEVIYDHSFPDIHGRRKTSFMIYQQELDQQVGSILRYHDELDPEHQLRRRRQIDKTFNPGPLRRLWRKVRNLVNTLRDAFNAAIGAVVGQYQRMNPANAVLAGQHGTAVATIGQTLLGKFANAYEPLLEQYIGQPIILDVADPLDPNNAVVEYPGYLADYTQNYIAVFNVEHTTALQTTVTLPQAAQGDLLPPASAAPAPGAPPPVQPAPIKVEAELAMRMDGPRIKIQNTRHEPVVVRQLEREGFEPLPIGMIISPNATLDLPARDAHGGKLVIEVVRCLDVVASRKYAAVRHAGQLAQRKGLAEEIHIMQLPLVPLLLGHNNGDVPSPPLPSQPPESAPTPSADHP